MMNTKILTAIGILIVLGIGGVFAYKSQFANNMAHTMGIPVLSPTASPAAMMHDTTTPVPSESAAQVTSDLNTDINALGSDVTAGSQDSVNDSDLNIQ